MSKIDEFYGLSTDYVLAAINAGTTVMSVFYKTATNSYNISQYQIVTSCSAYDANFQTTIAVVFVYAINFKGYTALKNLQ